MFALNTALAMTVDREMRVWTGIGRCGGSYRLGVVKEVGAIPMQGLGLDPQFSETNYQKHSVFGITRTT